VDDLVIVRICRSLAQSQVLPDFDFLLPSADVLTLEFTLVVGVLVKGRAGC